MRRTACSLALVAMSPLALQAQRLELAPVHTAPAHLAPAQIARTGSAPNGAWCFGVKLRPRDHCSGFAVLEIGARFRVSPQTDHSTADPAHAYPTLENHGYLALGALHRIATRSALGAVGEYGNGGGERLAFGVRFDQQLGEVARLDLTAGTIRVQTHQRGVTKRRTAGGTFIDGAVRANDLLVLQARVEHVPGMNGLVKPANAAYLGMRVEGGGAVKTTVAAAAILAVLELFVFFGGGGD